MKQSFKITLNIIVFLFLSYAINPRVKFYTHFGIWLPLYCFNIDFIKNPDFMAIFFSDGRSAETRFQIANGDIENLVKSMEPQGIWLKYSELDSTLSDKSLNQYEVLPEDVLNGKVKFMLYSNDTKGDFYNIWIIPGENGKMNVSISMTFT